MQELSPEEIRKRTILWFALSWLLVALFMAVFLPKMVRMEHLIPSAIGSVISGGEIQK